MIFLFVFVQSIQNKHFEGFFDTDDSDDPEEDNSADYSDKRYEDGYLFKEHICSKEFRKNILIRKKNSLFTGMSLI